MKISVIFSFLFVFLTLEGYEFYDTKEVNHYLFNNQKSKKNSYKSEVIFYHKKQLKQFYPRKDKVDHFVASSFLYVWNYHFQYDILKNNEKKSLVAGVSLTALVGVGKEFYDKSIKGTGFSFYDLSYDFIGIMFGIGLIKICEV